MKTYRVWAYETIGHYVDIRANNKADAYTKAMDVNVLDWEQSGGDEIADLNIKKKDIEEIKTNIVKLKIKKPWSEGYKEWKENYDK
tara:strand:- start:1458 stop:1715 length:258 start_codon:yes stop_codon:yes gene_type:complete